MTEEKRSRTSPENEADMKERYSRQIRLDQVGIEGQVINSWNSDE